MSFYVFEVEEKGIVQFNNSTIAAAPTTMTMTMTTKTTKEQSFRNKHSGTSKLCTYPRLAIEKPKKKTEKRYTNKQCDSNEKESILGAQ